MKRLLALSLSILALISMLSAFAFAATLELEDDYVTGEELVLASMHGVKPFIADSVNPEPVLEASYWLADNAEKLNLKYVSFIGNMSSGANFKHKQIVAEQGKTYAELISLNLSDSEWKRDFEELRSSAEPLNEIGVPYGISIGIKDYVSDAIDRENHVQTVFSTEDFFGNADIQTEVYDINNFAVITKINKTKYIIYQLEAFPRQKVINWFYTVQAENQDKRAIIYTTSFIKANGEMYTQHDWSVTNGKLPSDYKSYDSLLKSNMINKDSPHDGTEIWEDIIKIYKNVLCIVSANDTPGTEIVTNTFKNDYGYPVLAVLANLENGYGATGKCYPILMKISEDNKTIDLRHLVPYYNKVGGYIKETKKVITLENVAELPAADPVTLLEKVPAQANGENVAYINGYENNLFKPNNNMTKAEACTIFARLLAQSQTIPTGYTTRFTDVEKGQWYYDAIAYLDEMGYFFTNTSNEYHPNEKITRAEFVELAYFASELEGDSNISFSDVDTTNKYYNAIIAAAASGLVNGYGDGSFKPNATITRAEVVTVINRMISLEVSEKTVAKDYLEKKFSDISGHWAEYQILMASNSNVHPYYFYTADLNQLKEDSKTIYFENDYVKVVIAKNGATVKELINKATGENVVGLSATPWFSYLITNSQANIPAKSAELENGRLKIKYTSGKSAYFIIDIKNNYFSVTLDTDLKSDVYGIVICNLSTNADWERDNPATYGLSAVAMTTTVDLQYYPGGSNKAAKGTTYSFIGTTTMGSKVAVAFSNMGEHRDILKDITDDIDINYGIKSTHGGAYALDNPDIYGDYVILTSGLTPETALETGKLANEYSIETIDVHQNSANTFIQGDFNFVCARNEQEKANKTFITGKVFKERITDVLKEQNVTLSLHTFSSLISPSSTRLLSDPTNLRDLSVGEQTWTLRGDLSERRTNIKTVEDASKFQCTSVNIPYSGSVFTKYIMIDDEIILVQQGTSSGFLNVKRAQCGTKLSKHKDGAIIYQLLGYYSGFQPKPLSPLFYKVAREMAKAYNEAGFYMIYLDALESFHRDPFLDDLKLHYYAYAEFVRELIKYCDVDPMVEMSSMSTSLWGARARAGAIDTSFRSYKNYKLMHFERIEPFLDSYYTATFGWYNFDPSDGERYQETIKRILHRDDKDFMGSLSIGYNFGIVCQPFSVANFENNKKLSDNFMYYGTYTRLREAGYFAPEVRNELINSEYEHRVFQQEDGSWAFRQMKYFKNKVFNTNDTTFNTAKAVNPFNAQTPFIRIENRYTVPEGEGTLVIAFDETKEATSYLGNNKINKIDLTNKNAYKIRVYGNGSETDALLISFLANVPTNVLYGLNQYDYFIPLNFTGWKDIILVENNVDDYEGYEFGITSDNYRHAIDMSSVINVRVTACGNCAGVKLGNLYAYTPADSAVKNPSVTIGGETITFETELHGPDYVEFYPEENKAYLNYYTEIFDENNNWKKTVSHVKEINFTGNITVPAGEFSYTYNAEAMTGLTQRAQVVIGLSGKVLANPDSWVAPKVDMPEGIYDVRLY